MFTVMSGGPTIEEIERETPTVVAEHSPSQREYQLIVPIANPEHVEQLMRTADDIAKARNGEILVMSVVTLPEQTPLSEGQQFVDEKREVIDEALALAEDADVPVSGTIRIAHHPDEAILNTIEQYDSDGVLLGWRGTGTGRRGIVLGSTVDTIAQEAECDVLVEKVGERPTTIDSILLPTAGGEHAELSAEIAQSIARSENAAVRVVNVVGPDASENDRHASQETIAETANLLADVTVEQTVIEGEDVAETIIDTSDEHDLTIIGATQEGLLQQLVFGAIPKQIAQEGRNTVIMAKRNEDLQSRLSRWLQRE